MRSVRYSYQTVVSARLLVLFEGRLAITGGRGYDQVREISVGRSTPQWDFRGVVSDLEGYRLRNGNSVHANSRPMIILTLSYMMNMW